MQEVCNREFFKGGSAMSFNDAKAYCAFKGATLAIISSQKSNIMRAEYVGEKTVGLD